MARVSGLKGLGSLHTQFQVLEPRSREEEKGMMGAQAVLAAWGCVGSIAAG